ncbi:glycosyltransferase [Poseidonibacter lekithochrous]|uniref:glycosyltransferase n=1 Tax=Poseidonibacter lekithochrous TaxID=1904463 RepID=UPI000D332A93|nr:glycosyltransferase [Poseidonibacter lekithochrous]
MKVLSLSLGRRGGCVQYSYGIFNELKSYSNYEFWISKYSEEIKPSSINLKEIITFKSKYTFVLSTLFILPFYLIKVFFYLITNKYTVLYLPYFHVWNIFFILLFKLFKKKVVITEHDGTLHSGEESYFEQLLRNINVSLASEAIVLSQNVKNILINVNKKIHIIPHGLISFEGLNTKKRIVHKKKLNILFFGRINKYKGLNIFLDAMRRLPDNLYDNINIVGGGDISTYDFTGITNLHVNNKFLEQDEIIKYFNESDILVLPYLEASQSGVITLGIASSIPMICSKLDGFEEQLNSDEAIFCEVNDFLSLKDELIMLIKNTDKYNKLSESLFNKQKTLDWCTISNQIHNICN